MYKPTFLLLLLFTICLGCGDDAAVAETATDETATAADSLAQEPARPPLSAGDPLRAWVDGLFIRAEPNKNGTIVAQVRSEAALEFTGKRSDTEETIVLRGMAFAEPWLQVRTADGQEGWVFGGAVQRPEESKGTGYQSETQFDFPQFGGFNLADWESEPAYESGGGDATTTLSVYQRGDRRLAVKRTDMGDHGYERLYTLTTGGGKLLKTREFVVRTDPAPRITETITDYAAEPPHVYTRQQDLSQHFVQLNAIPEIATGKWKERTE